jgi:carboxyl-terminal processing protease
MFKTHKIFKRFALVLIVFGTLAAISPSERYFEIAKNLDVFASAFREVNATYVDEVNPNKLMRTGIDAMLASLDPYTNYISEDEVENFRTQNTGQYGGIGAVTRQIKDRTVITMVMEGFAAQRVGLKIGDEVLKIDQVALSRVSSEEAGSLMKGQLGTPVSLTVKRPGVAEPIILSFKREKIKVNNVPHFTIVGDETGYIQLTDFTPDAGKEVRNALVALKEKGAKNIVLDLRGNPGGLLQEAVNICNLFIPKGKLVVTTRGKNPESTIAYETLNPPVDLDIPLVVLIDRGSASASEIVAGTLQDYDRAVIIGEKSFGKGLVQVNRPLSYKSIMKVTTAKYYTPSGRCIQVLDYANRREDGSAGSVPDSLKRAFKTSHGRTVYDGGGIDPDVALYNDPFHAIVQVLFEEGYLFDYATDYTQKHASPTNSKSFQLTDAEYSAFVQWMNTKTYSYTTELDEQLESMQQQAKREKNYEELKPLIEKLAVTITEKRKHDLVTHRKQIKQALEADILSRYFLEQGYVEANFKYDTELQKAITLFADATQYNKLLTRL